MQFHQQREAQYKLDELKMVLSDQNLQLVPEYHDRLNVLQQMGYIDENGTVQLKGRVACEVHFKCLASR